MASIKEVAQKAGVGVGTVSRVLNSTGYVSDETRIKVETAMKELNYIPNELARNLLSKKSGFFSIILPKISHPFFAEVVLYAEAELMKKGYCVLQIQGARVVDSPSHERHYEFERYMKKRGVTVYSHEMDWNDFDYGQYDVMADMLMDKYPDIDGIFAVDMVAIACIRQLLKRKKKVPRDVKVVAYDGTYVAKVGVMNLTVVQQPIEELAKRAVNILLNMIQGKKYHNKKVFYEPTLLLGDTTDDKE